MLDWNTCNDLTLCIQMSYNSSFKNKYLQTIQLEIIYKHRIWH